MGWQAVLEQIEEAMEEEVRYQEARSLKRALLRAEEEEAWGYTPHAVADGLIQEVVGYELQEDGVTTRAVRLEELVGDIGGAHELYGTPYVDLALRHTQRRVRVRKGDDPWWLLAQDVARAIRFLVEDYRKEPSQEAMARLVAGALGVVFRLPEEVASLEKSLRETAPFGRLLKAGGSVTQWLWEYGATLALRKKRKKKAEGEPSISLEEARLMEEEESDASTDRQRVIKGVHQRLVTLLGERRAEALLQWVEAGGLEKGGRIPHLEVLQRDPTLVGYWEDL